MAIIGIDLGTTNSLVSVWKDGKSVLVPNEYGEYLTPSIVSVDGDTVYVGKVAKERMVSCPQNSARQFKRNMGTSRKYRLGEKNFLPEELSALVLRKLKVDAERFLGEPVEEAVISVPAYFNDNQRWTTKRAGEMAGLKVERLINEPSAAALLSKQETKEKDGNLLMFDFGGGTLDVSVVECFQNVVNVLSIRGDNQLGGCDFDELIARNVCQKLSLSFLELSEKDRSRLLFQSEQLKWKLTDNEEATMEMFIFENRYSVSMDRRELVNISTPIFKKIDQIVKGALVDASMDLAELSQIILVGGSSKMPVIRHYVRYLLGEIPIMQQNPDEIVGLGVGCYAGIKERKEELKEMVLMDICPFSLGVNTYNRHCPQEDLMSVIISRNTSLPTSQKERYHTVCDNQKFMDFGIYQGENLHAEENEKIGNLKVDVLSKPKGMESAEVSFAYDINGLLLVKAFVPSTNKSFELVIAGRHCSGNDKARIKELDSLKPDTEKPENRLLIERARRMYEEFSGKEKEKIWELIQLFEDLLTSNRLANKQMAYARLKGYLDNLEAYSETVLENTFNPDWYVDRDQVWQHGEKQNSPQWGFR